MNQKLLTIGKLIGDCDPNNSLPPGSEFYIDFSDIRGTSVVKLLKRSITDTGKDESAQLFAGHIGCGKSTELHRLEQELDADGFHVVYFDSDHYLDMGDVSVTDILLVISDQVAHSLQKGNVMDFKSAEKDREHLTFAISINA